MFVIQVGCFFFSPVQIKSLTYTTSPWQVIYPPSTHLLPTLKQFSQGNNNVCILFPCLEEYQLFNLHKLLVTLKNKYYQLPPTLIFRLGMNKQVFPQPAPSVLFCRSYSSDKIFQCNHWSRTSGVEWGEEISAHSPPCPWPSSSAVIVDMGFVISGHRPHGSQHQQARRRSHKGKEKS